MKISTIPLGEQAPQIINAIIEIPRGSHAKYEYDEELDIIRLDRILYSPVYYPANYGFIPSTRSEDGDQLDVLVIISEPIVPGCLVSVRPVGLIDMEDDAGKDWKIISVAARDPRLEHVNTTSDLGEHFAKEVQHFFEVYKHLENKQVKFLGLEDQAKAYKIILEAHQRFTANPESS
jgi:inorganic pyrophosphatase